MTTHILDINITRLPSWDRLSKMLGEWKDFTDGKINIHPRSAFEIAGYCYAIYCAKRSGETLPKDWCKCHPSLPYQMLSWHERMIKHPIIKDCPNPPATWIDLS